MSRGALRAGVVAVALAGIALAGYLTWVHFDEGALVCTGGGGCETVQESDYAELAGIPVAVLGLGAWVTVLALAIWDSPLARALTAALALGALAFAAYLVALQLFVIDAICTWCMINDLVLIPLVTLLAILRLRGDDEAAAPI